MTRSRVDRFVAACGCVLLALGAAGRGRSAQAAVYSGGTAQAVGRVVVTPRPFEFLGVGEDACAWEAAGQPGFSNGGVEPISVSADGDTPYVAFPDWSRGRRATVMRYDGNGGWETLGAAGFSRGQADGISLCARGGTPYVSYTETSLDGALVVKEYEEGRGWVDVGGQPFPAVQSFETSLFVHDGTPYVAYGECLNGECRATVMRYDDNAGWSAVGNTRFSSGDAAHIDLFVDDEGGTAVPYVLYSAQEGGFKCVVKRYRQAGGWQTVGQPYFSGENPQSLSLYVDRGTPYVAYSAGGEGIPVKRYDGGAWRTLGNMGADVFVHLVVNDGMPYVAYGPDASVRKYTPEGEWIDVGEPSFSDGRAFCLSSCVSGGALYVAYKDMAHASRATVMRRDITPEIRVLDGEDPVSSGSEYDLGSPGVRNSNEVAFTIENTGCEDLRLGPVAKAGDVRREFTVVQPADSVIPPGGRTTFGVRFAPNSPGEKSATISIPTNDPDVNPFSLTVAGHGPRWRPVGAAGVSAGEACDISLRADGGTLFLAYEDQGRGGRTVVKRCDDGRNWRDVGAGTVSPGAAVGSSLALYRGTPCVAYTDRTRGDTLTVKGFDPARGMWSAVGPAGFTAAAAYYASLSLYDDNGVPVPYVAYMDCEFILEGRLVRYMRATVKKFNRARNAWETVGTREFSGGEVYYTSLHVPASGGAPLPLVGYSDGGSGLRATMMSYNAGFNRWSPLGPAGFTPTEASMLSFAVDGVTPYVAYTRDYQNGGRCSAMRYDAGARRWELLGREGFSDGGAFSPSLCVEDGVPYVAYMDVWHNGRVTVMWYDADRGAWAPVGLPGFSDGASKGHVSLQVLDGVPYVAFDDSAHGGRAMVMKYE